MVAAAVVVVDNAGPAIVVAVAAAVVSVVVVVVAAAAEYPHAVAADVAAVVPDADTAAIVGRSQDLLSYICTYPSGSFYLAFFRPHLLPQHFKIPLGLKVHSRCILQLLTI